MPVEVQDSELRCKRCNTIQQEEIRRKEFYRICEARTTFARLLYSSANSVQVHFGPTNRPKRPVSLFTRCLQAIQLIYGPTHSSHRTFATAYLYGQPTYSTSTQTLCAFIATVERCYFCHCVIETNLAISYGNSVELGLLLANSAEKSPPPFFSRVIQ